MQENENNLNYNNINNIDSDIENQEENLTNSDINDSKYLPSNNILENNNLINITKENKNEDMFLKSKINSLQNDTVFLNQKKQELINKNNILKQKLSQLNEKLQSKDGINFEYQNFFFDVYKQNFEQCEQKNNELKKKRRTPKKIRRKKQRNNGK